jgi:hypothetical protein
VSLWVFLLALRIGEGELEVGEKGSADQQEEKGLLLLKLLGGVSPDPTDKRG